MKKKDLELKEARIAYWEKNKRLLDLDNEGLLIGDIFDWKNNRMSGIA